MKKTLREYLADHLHWLLSSRKALVACVTAAGVGLSRLLTRCGFSPAEIDVLMGAWTILGSTWVVSIALDNGKPDESVKGEQP